MRFDYMRRSLTAFVMAVILMLSSCLFGLPVQAAESSIVSAIVSPLVVNPGASFTLNIVVQPASAIAGAQFNISFNPDLFTVTDVVEGNLMNQNGADTYFSPGKIDNGAGTITGVAGVVTNPGQSVSNSGTLAVVTLMAGVTGGTSLMTLSNVILGDLNGQPLSVNMVNGQVSVNRPPVLNAIGNRSVTASQSLIFTITASDPDGGPLTYIASNLPSGASFNPSTRTFSWKPTANQVGTYANIRFEVSDGISRSYENITIVVNKKASRK